MSEDLSAKKCKVCEGGMPVLSGEESSRYLSRVMGWELIDGKKIKKEYKFKNFRQSLDFVNKVGSVAEEQGHYPNIIIIYNRVRITASTHAIGGLSENDFIIAAKVDILYNNKIV